MSKMVWRLLRIKWSVDVIIHLASVHVLSPPIPEPEGDRRASEDRGQAEADAGEDQADA